MVPASRTWMYSFVGTKLLDVSVPMSLSDPPRKELVLPAIGPAAKARPFTCQPSKDGLRKSSNTMSPGLSTWVASDVGLSELRDFAALLQGGDSAAAATVR